MTVLTDTEFRGRKQKVGSVLFSKTGRLMFFLAYCDNCHGKCVVTNDEARLLIRRFANKQNKLTKRIAIKMLRKYASD